MSSMLLVDLSIIFRGNWHATGDQSIGEAFERTIDKVHSLRSGYEHVAICLDTPPYWRKAIAQSYKANRPEVEPVMTEQFGRVKARLAADGLLLWGADSFESDDVIAWAAREAISKNIAVVVASGDKDLLSLVDDATGVRVLSTSSGKMYDRTAVIEKLGVAPDQVTDFLALTGDKSDNIAGIPGVGPVKAAKLLMQYGTLDEVLANADTQTPALRDALIEHAGAARLARKLVTLRTDVPLDFSEIFQERKPQPLTDQSYTEGFDDEGEEPDDEPFTPDISSPPATPQPTPAVAPEAPPSKSEPKVEVVERPNGERQAPIVPYENQQEWSVQLQPRSIEGVYKLSKGLLESRLYTKLGNAEAIMAVILRGREMGLTALTALDCFHVIEGKPAPYAHLIIARAQAHADCEYFQMLESDDEHAVYETKHRRNPSPTRLRYTIAQAELAGRLRPNSKGGPSQWVKMPAEFLRKTCAVQLTRIVYPDAALGLYAVEELE